jgi:hypothetical protein
MTATLGLVKAAAQLGFQSLLVKPQRSIGLFIPAAVFEENHIDELEITDHPIEYGATVADHAYRRPAEVTIHCGWSNSPNKTGLLSASLGLASLVTPIAGIASAVIGAVEGLTGSDHLKGIYTKMLDLQRTRELFDVHTGKRTYQNMLIKTLSVTTDKNSENTLMVTVVCREIIIARTTSVQMGAVNSDPAKQAAPEKTSVPTKSGTKTLAPAPKFNSKSPVPFVPGGGNVNPNAGATGSWGRGASGSWGP